MKAKDVAKWNMRGAAVYALGVWTMIGSFGYLTYTGRLKDLPVEEVEEQEQENPNMQVFQSKHRKTVVVMKENFVPYTTRIHRFITSFTDRTNAPQDGASSSNRDGDTTDTRVD